MARGQAEAVDERVSNPTTRWRSLAEIAAHLGLHEASVRNYMQRHGLPGYRLGAKDWRFDLDEVDRWLKARQGKKTRAVARPNNGRKALA